MSSEISVSSSPERRSQPSPHTPTPVGWTLKRGLAGTGVIFLGAIVGSLQFARPSSPAPLEPFARIARADSVLAVGASANAFGASREVRLRFALPGTST